MNLEITSLRSYSLSYKNLVQENYIEREILLNELESLATPDNKIIIVEGAEGVGKTTLLLEFARRHLFDCFCYFINPSSRLSSKADYLMEDLGKQMLYHLNPEKIEEDSPIDETSFNTLAMDLTRHTSKKEKRVFFVLDGLDQIEKSELDLLKPLLLGLPWNFNNFYFIVSGSSENILSALTTRTIKKYKTFRTIRFSYEETLRFFSWDDSPVAKEVYNTWNGHPEALAQVKRILNTGTAIEDFLKEDRTEKNDLLDIEWKKANIEIKDGSQNLTKFLAILAFDENLKSTERILQIIGERGDNLVQELEKISFLSIRENEVTYISNSFKQFARKKLQRFEKMSFKLLIDFYKEQDDVSRVQNLPFYYEKNQDWASILSLLTAGNLSVLVTKSKSFAEIKRELNFGYKASNNTKKDYGNVFRFSLYRSLVNGLQKSDLREAQMKAYIALGKKQDMFALISKAVLMEDRIRIMINYAKESKLNETEIDPIILQEISDKIEEVDKEYLKENIIEIATGLAHILPEKAVKVIEVAFGKREDTGSLELLLNYINYIANQYNSDNTKNTPIDLTNVRLEQSFGESFAKSVGYGIGEMSDDDVVRSLNEVENVADRLYLVKAWIKKNLTHQNVLRIIEYAINVNLASSSIIPLTTTNLLEIFAPLPSLSNKLSAEQMIVRLDGLMEDIENPLNDKINLKLLIIKTLANFDLESAGYRMIELYDEIHDVSDLPTKIASLANCWLLIKDLEKRSEWQSEQFILSVYDVKTDITKSIDNFLDDTAEQYDELKDTFEILPKLDFAFAVQVAKRLNTRPRRSEAITKCIGIYVGSPFDEWSVIEIKSACRELTQDDYTEATFDIINEAVDQKHVVANQMSKLIDITPLINNIEPPHLKCLLIAKCLEVLHQPVTEFVSIQPNFSKFIAKMSGFLDQFWNKIDDPIVKIGIGYSLASRFSKFAPEMAETYFVRAEASASYNVIDNRIHLYTYVESIRLLIRIYSKMVQKNVYFSNDKIASLIEFIPSNQEKISLWSELVIRSWLSGNKIVVDEVVKRNVLPILDLYSSANENYVPIIKSSAAAIYFAQPENFRLLMRPLDIRVKESIISSICRVITDRVYEKDPTGEQISSTVDFNLASDYINLIEQLETDYVLFDHVKRLCYVAKTSSNNFSRGQKSDLRRRLMTLVQNKLPNSSTGVGHQGYLLACKACITYFNERVDERVNEFEELDKQTMSIPNTTDRALVYLILGRECLHRKKKQDLFIKCLESADDIISTRERLNIYEQCLEELSKDFPDLFKQKVLLNQQQILNLDEKERYRYYRKLIDLCFKHDKKLALRMLSALENDPGRKQLNSQAADYYEQLELESDAQSDYSKIGRIRSRRSMGKVVDEMLGELNANKRNKKNLEQCIAMIYTASAIPFFYSLPLFEFFIENIQDNFTGRESILSGMYEAADSSARLCFNLISNISSKEYTLPSSDSKALEDTLILKPGMREVAFKFIEEYVKNNCNDEICIVDPYFKLDDISFVKDLSYWSEGANISVVTSYQSEEHFNKFLFRKAWQDISSEALPKLTITSVAYEDKTTPLHDRWIILPDQLMGLRLGTSINSLGNKVGDISKMSADEIENIIGNVLDPLLEARARTFNDKRMIYDTIQF